MKNSLNNISDINSFLKEKDFKKLLKKIDSKKKIKINNKIIHKKNLSHKEQFLYNLDMYINFIKSKVFINQFELRYIIYLTLFNRNNNILFHDVYYYEDTNYYINKFIKMFMSNYLKNYRFLSKYINIKKRNFTELIDIINKNKKRTYVYFEDININNMNFYIPLILNIESNS